MEGKVSCRAGRVDGVVRRRANDRCVPQSKEAVANNVLPSRDPDFSRNDAGFGDMDAATAAAAMVAIARVDATSRRGALSYRQVAAAGGRRIAIDYAANQKQRTSLFGKEFRQKQESQVAMQVEEQEETQQKTRRAGQAADLVDAHLAYGLEVAVVLENGSFDIE